MKHLLICILGIIISCSPSTPKDTSMILLKDLTELNGIQNITIFNNKGEHKLDPEQKDQLINGLNKLSYKPEYAAKVGGNAVHFELNGKEYSITGNSRGEYFEIHRDLISKKKYIIGEAEWLYFNANELNLDNF